METYITIFAIMTIIMFLVITVLLGVIIDITRKLPRKPVTLYRPLSEERKTPNEMRAEYGFGPISKLEPKSVWDPNPKTPYSGYVSFNQPNRNTSVWVHTPNPIKIAQIDAVSEVGIFDLQKQLEWTRLWYEHQPESISKDDLYKLLNQYVERASVLSTQLRNSKIEAKLLSGRAHEAAKEKELWHKMYDLMEKTYQETEKECRELREKLSPSPSMRMKDVGVIFVKEN